MSFYGGVILPRLIDLVMRNKADAVWQDRLTPFWARVAGGCHLNRPIDALIEEAGFSPLTLDRGYATGPKPMAYLYKGVAVTPKS